MCECANWQTGSFPVSFKHQDFPHKSLFMSLSTRCCTPLPSPASRPALPTYSNLQVLCCAAKPLVGSRATPDYKQCSKTTTVTRFTSGAVPPQSLHISVVRCTLAIARVPGPAAPPPLCSCTTATIDPLAVTTTSRTSFRSAAFIMELCTVEASRSAAMIAVSCASGGPRAQKFPQRPIPNHPGLHPPLRPARPATHSSSNTTIAASTPLIVDAYRSG